MTVKVTTRARAAASTAKAAKKPVPKQTAPAKKTASRSPATKTAARATPSRARKAAPAPVVKDTPVRKTKKQPVPEFSPLQERRAAVDLRKRVGGMSYKQLAELSGFGLGTEQFIAAVEVVIGGASRLAVNHRVAAMLPAETRNGTPKQISNLVGGVIRTLEQRGFTATGTWKMAPPKA